MVQCRREGQPIIARSTQQFDFLGYTFCQRNVQRKDGSLFRSVLPAMSRRKEKDIRTAIRQHLNRASTGEELRHLAASLNQRLRGWHEYFATFYGSLYKKRIDYFVNQRIKIWAMKKYKRLKRHPLKAHKWFLRVRKESPYLFWYWTVGMT